MNTTNPWLTMLAAVAALTTAQLVRAAEGFVLIPAGSFQMGNALAATGEGDRDELPVHPAYVSAFYLGKFEVSKTEWDAVRAWGVNNGYPDLPVGGSKGPDHPILYVSWEDCVKWCNARSQQENLTPCYTVAGAIYQSGSGVPVFCNSGGDGYRLPTEAEWEKAARGGLAGKRFSHGDTITQSQANYYSSSSFAYDVSPTRGYHPTFGVGPTAYTSPGGSFAPNGYGLYDMTGNVWEWCNDCYHSDSFTWSPPTDPQGAPAGLGRLLRGGGWNTSASSCRVSFRGVNYPDYRDFNCGFRLARSFAVPDGFALIPAGSFQMGQDGLATPVHTVTLSAFHLANHEVTKALWDEVAGWAADHGYDITATDASGKGANHPAYDVSWIECVKWCNARSEKEGLTPCYHTYNAPLMVFRTGDEPPDCNWSADGYRLPTEAEWEKAARGGSTGKLYPWGTDFISHLEANFMASGTSHGNLSGNDSYHPAFNDSVRPYTAPVGSFAPNGYGLYDMAGNLYEWCWNRGYDYQSGSQTDPHGPDWGTFRIFRGGSWEAAPICNTAAARAQADPPTHGSSEVGFRPARKAFDLVALPSTLTVTEGGTSTFTVRLDIQPPGDVTVTTVRTTGDSDLAVSGGASLTFTPANWNEPQTVTIAAAEDADASDDQAAFDLSATNLTSRTVAATESDNDLPELTVVAAAQSILEGAGPAATTVMITRNLELAHALTVALASSEPASATVPVTAIIPAGEASVTVNLEAVDDAVEDGPASVTITASATGFVSGTATVRVADDEIRFVEWAHGSGLIYASALPLAVPHGDGVANLLKYAFNLNGNGPDVRCMVAGTGRCGLPVLTRNDSGSVPVFRFEYLRRKFGGLSYTPVQSATLAAASWLPMTGPITVTDLNETWERVVVEEPAEAGVTARFFRVEVTQPDGFVLIPAGGFLMGDQTAPNYEGDSDEQPQHAVYVSAFHMAKHEVTKAQWDEVAGWAATNGYHLNAAGASGKGADHPVQLINWWAAVKWCNARSQMEGLTPCYYTDAAQTVVYKTGNLDLDTTRVKWDANGYRLPTEAEWEKAARGGVAGKRYPWGTDTISHSEANYFATDRSYGNLSVNAGSHPDYRESYPYSSPVGSLPPNGYGLYDMAGNAWEWCWDWYSGSYYSSAPDSDPQGPAVGAIRVFRGGGWDHGAKHCRAAFRYGSSPLETNDAVGFRLARSSVQ